MLTKRLLGILVAIAVLTIAGYIAGTHTVLSAAAPNSVEASDYFQRHPNVVIPVTGGEVAVDLSDYYQRHPTALNLGSTVDTTDYVQRHANSFKPANTVDLSDWVQRHPSLIGH
jgi:hypothetical protein